MMRIRSLVLLLIALIAAPLFAARGTADFTRFVVLGDSYAAGVESASLNVNHQQFSWPAVIARQAGAPDFQQPLVSFPGIGPELQLVDIIHFPPTILPASTTNGQPINLNLPRPYNNLAVPGANVADLTTLTGKQQVTGTATAFAQFILRGLGTEVQQAIAQQPTFIAIWIGGNDALGAVESGTPAALTPLDTFKTGYNAMLDQLTAGAPNAGMVVGTIADNVLAVPFLTAVQPVIINPQTRQPLLINGAQVPLIADLGGGNIGALPAGSVVLLSAATKVASGFGIPPQLAQAPPFNQFPNAGKPLADSDVLTPTELATIKQRVDDFNTVITQAASARNIPVADIKGLFDRLAARDASGALVGMNVGPITLSSAFITGGAFSLDGIHMTDIGYTLFADEYIKAINDAYGTRIPLAPVTNFEQNNILTVSGQVFIPGEAWEMSEEAEAQIRSFAPTIMRRHAVH
jgi:hypothetical protein